MADFLALLNQHNELIILPLLFLIAGVVAFTAIWRSTRKPEQYPAEVERFYVIKCLGEDEPVLKVRAFDVHLVEEYQGSLRYLNFLGPKIGDIDRITVAVQVWSDDYTVTSEPA